MKKSLVLAGLLFATSNIFAAQEGNIYVGAAYNTGSGEIEEKTTSTTTVDTDVKSTSIKVGYVLQNDNRIEFSYESLTFELDGYTWYGKAEPEATVYNFDYKVTYPSGVFAPYWTLGLGLYSLEDTGSNFSNSSEDLKGTSINYGAGFLYEVASNMELEVSYNFRNVSWEDVEVGSVKRETSGSHSYLSVGFNILF